MFVPARVVHPIETRSYEILRGRVDTTPLPPLTRAVTERVIHTTADPSWAGDLVAREEALSGGRAALRGGAPIVADVRMLAAGITAGADRCTVGLDLPGVPDRAAAEETTRSAAGIRLAAERFPDGAVWAIGNAPTALAELVTLAGEGLVRPALVIGVPVGFVGAVEAKAVLRRSGLPALSTVTERGGAAIATAAVNALLYFEHENETEQAQEGVA